MTEFDQRVRWQVYDVTMSEGAPPLAARIADALQSSTGDVHASLERLASARMLVLQRESREILMAGPFSAVPTPFRVTTEKLAAYGNCIWDALGVIAMLGQPDARIDTSCGDCGTSAQLFIEDGAIRGEGFMHFLLPPKVWWQDVVFT